MQNSFSYERIALRLVLIQRPKRTQKWSISSPLIIGEMFVPSLYRQNYLAAENPRDFRAFFIQREIPRRWSSTRFSYLLHTDRIISPLKIGEIFVPSLYRQNYLAAENRRDFLALFIKTELSRRWKSARFSCLLYTDRNTSPLIIGEIFVPSLYTDRISSPLIIGEIFVPSLYRQNYIAADYRRDFRAFFIQTELACRWL